MSRTEALRLLKSTRTLSTNMLEPLGIPFENFLRLAQMDRERRQIMIDKIIKHLEGGER